MLFDEVFVERLLELGKRDATRWLAEHPGLWTSESAGEPLETIALDEFRALRRR
jgi:NTE family protein